ncbi:hypothetical protein [Oceanobacillus bengalensis]|uniref:DUF4352 domain-containing protein n=1 Tax=Oceanobacillus bengalensis TaxID=1435466 RepID=A0A494Z072_9BACI|nr:hypothetical protein [Oceanobacillus bengalensis]RKQ15885.1 hypothetical protein D8M05_09000 [Oceanobacillus bengalensis]
MNKLLLSLLVPAILILGACNGEDQNEKAGSSHQEDNSRQGVTESKEQNNENHFDQKETETFGGEFRAVAHKEDIGEVEIGPLTINIVVSNLVTGTITDPFILDNIGKENIDYINIGIEISTTNEDINFSSEHLKLTTNTGESFESPHDYLSDKVEMQYIKEAYTRSRMICYLFEDSKVEDVESANLIIKAPTDKDGQPLGEDANIKIEF